MLAVLGVADAEQLFDAVDAVVAGERAAPAGGRRLAESGRDAGQLVRDLEVARARAAGRPDARRGPAASCGVTPERDGRLAEQAAALGRTDVVRLLDLLSGRARGDGERRAGADPARAGARQGGGAGGRPVGAALLARDRPARGASGAAGALRAAPPARTPADPGRRARPPAARRRAAGAAGAARRRPRAAAPRDRETSRPAGRRSRRGGAAAAAARPGRAATLWPAVVDAVRRGTGCSPRCSRTRSRSTSRARGDVRVRRRSRIPQAEGRARGPPPRVRGGGRARGRQALRPSL